MLHLRQAPKREANGNFYNVLESEVQARTYKKVRLRPVTSASGLESSAEASGHNTCGKAELRVTIAFESLSNHQPYSGRLFCRSELVSCLPGKQRFSLTCQLNLQRLIQK